jgi:hypothetical protein
MKSLAFLFLACILAGFALVNLPAISFLSGLFPFFHIVGALAVLVFSLALIYEGIKAFFSK